MLSIKRGFLLADKFLRDSLVGRHTAEVSELWRIVWT